ncbi:Phenylalanine--tRNA ligase beta subunit [Spathaspora sp. JA1]|nr:Phenylalanine--tRNA ligase beta subunit [Spathaspora sp. JA1]
MDYYNEKGGLEFTSESGREFLNNDTDIFGYTKIDTEEQVNKYASLDRKTDFLFRSRNDEKKDVAKYEEELEGRIEKESQDSEYEDEDNLDSQEALEDTKNMLTDSQKFAYIGIAKLLTVEMATDLAKLHIAGSGSIAKTLSAGQKNFSNWTLYVMSKLYSHLNISDEEQKMIENLSKHGLEVEDLTKSLLELGINASVQANRQCLDDDFDLRWVIVCDLFLILVGDGFYDARSRSLLIKFSGTLDIPSLEIFQFERRLIECLEIETKDRTIENKEELLDDPSLIAKQIKKNRNKRLAYIGLATIGGSLAIGLSAGLLAPVIGAGLAAGLTTVGITGTSGFLAGVGGSAIITTVGIATGAKVGSTAGARRTGDVHTFEFKPLHNNKRTNLIITVSGWMNGKMDDVRLPFSTVDPVMGDMFSLLWEPEMLQSMGQTIGILASEALSTSIQQILGHTILTGLMAAIQIPMVLSKLSYLLDNPWNVSLDRAWKAGKILAETLIAGNVGIRPITLVGFSLGSRVIYSCLIELSRRGGYGLVENVIILGSPISIKTDQLIMARSVVSGKFVNGYSKKDWILGYLFRATGGGVGKVAGLSALTHVDGIENIDCTNLIEGHMSYRKVIPKILKLVNWEVLSEEFAEIEEADPEQGERQRQLIHEFDEARAKMEKEKQQAVEPKGWKKWFKPKNKDWWEIYGQNPASSSNEEVNSSTSANNSNGHEEYKVEEEVFNLDALQKEVNEIENLAQKDKKSIEQLRKEQPKSIRRERKMPTIPVDKEDLYKLLGKSYTTEEFDELCFDFGLELDEDTTEDCQGDERPQLKIEVPANRYDMLCIEGIAQALNEFLGNVEPPKYTLNPARPVTSLTIKESTLPIRQYAASAILRNVSFDERTYDSFIAFQDKLHTNLCRNRTLVAIGTHDLDTLTPPFTYEALAPEDIKFKPLNQEKEMNGHELMEFYEKDKNLGKYLHIIKDSPVYPVMLDANRTVASMPPIINSDHSKITLNTKNVWIDVTGTDKTKTEVVIEQIVAMFSRYCKTPFEIEPLDIISEHNGETRITPNITPRVAQAEISYINSCLGLDYSGEEISKLLKKMALDSSQSKENSDIIDVKVPITRSDVLHQCDIMEDAAISYGYNNLTKTKPKSASLVAAPLPINKVADILRLASSQAGYSEVMPLTLCSHDENFKFLRQTDDGTVAVKLANPKTIEYQVVRTTLLPGILKTIKENRKHSLPIKVFESGDIVLKNPELERRAFNQRNWCAIYAGKTSGFEYVQGLLGKIMQTMRTQWLENPKENKGRGYWIEEDKENPTFFPGRGAKIFFRAVEGGEDQHIGALGVLHPEVMTSFEIPYAASSVEINAEVFL